MADYINSNILCQAYIHIEPENLSQTDIDKIVSTLEEFVRTRGQFFLYKEIEVNVQLKDGSLKKYLTIGGCIYIFLHQYADFREGVTLFYQDVQRLAESIVSESLFLTKARHQNILRTEARTGILGSLKDIVDDLNYVEGGMGSLTADQLYKRLSVARIRIERVMEVIKDDRDHIYVQDALLKVVLGLPSTPPPVPKKTHSSQAILIYRNERDEIIKFLQKKKPKK